MTVRVIDFGYVPALSSQAIYHGIADALLPKNDPVITLINPTDPYLSVGALQDVQHEVNEDYCRARGLPIIRREIGGGAVYLDRNQMFYHYIFPRRQAPATADELYPWFIKPVVYTYRSFGIDAVYRPVNDIHVAGRKIGGTAAALIGHAVVLGGSFMLDFDGATMARCLKVPSEKLRDKLSTTLADYVTSMSRLLPAIPDRATIKRHYLEAVSVHLGQPLLRNSGPTAAERAAIAAREVKMAHPDFTYRAGCRRPAAGVKVTAGVHLTEGATKALGGLIWVLLLERDGHIADLEISGDFTCLPAAGVAELAARLRGAALAGPSLTRAIAAVIADLGLDLPGVTAADLARAIASARHPDA